MPVYGCDDQSRKTASAGDWQSKVDKIIFFHATGLPREKALDMLHDLQVPMDAAGRWLDRAHLTHGKG
jgi:hypothetical protein